MNEKTRRTKRRSKKTVAALRGRGQPEAAVFNSKKASKVASRRVAGAQRAAQARQQQRRDSH